MKGCVDTAREHRKKYRFVNNSQTQRQRERLELSLFQQCPVSLLVTYLCGWGTLGDIQFCISAVSIM